MSKQRKERDEGTRCALMPGERFHSHAEADEMRLTRQVNVAVGGMGQVDYAVKKCACGSYHVLTQANLDKWEAKRRATRQERKRNA